MRQKNGANFHAIIAAITVVAFVAISSYLYLNGQTINTPSVPGQNSATVAEQATSGNTTTYSYATATANQSVTNTDSIPQGTLTTTVQIQSHPVQHFGNQYFEPPSAILVPANTLIWTNFLLNGSSKEAVGGSVLLFPFPDATGVNVTVAIYLNGTLKISSTTPLLNHDYGISPSLIPSSNSTNSVFALTGMTPDVGMGTQTGSLSFNNATTVTIAISTDKSIWLAGWSQTDMSSGKGPQHGQSAGQLSGTYEGPEAGTSLPSSLPHATAKLSFELQIPGVLVP